MVGNINDGIAFATTSNEQKKKKDKNHVTCHQCGEKRHYANEITKCKAATEKILKNLLESQLLQ